MPDCFSKSEVTDFMNFMKLPDGTSVVSDDMMEYLMAYGFFTAPASTKYHGNYEGGLLNHSRMVTEYLLALTMRCPVAAHPDMRIVANMLLTLLKQTYPVFFEDIEV